MKQIITIVAIFISLNLIMIGLIFTPNLAFGTVKTDDSNIITTSKYEIYDQISIKDEVFFLAQTNEKVFSSRTFVLGKSLGSDYAIINDSLYTSNNLFRQLTRAPRLIGVFNDLLYVNLIPGAIFNGTEKPKSYIAIYNTDGIFENRISTDFFGLNSYNYVDGYNGQMMIVNDHLYFLHVGLGPSYFQKHLISVDLENTSTVITRNRSNFMTWYTTLHKKDDQAYLMYGTDETKLHLSLLSSDLSISNITQFEFPAETLNYGSGEDSQNIFFYSEDQIFYVSKNIADTGNQSIITLYNVITDQEYRITYNESIQDISLTGNGRFILLTGYYFRQHNLNTEKIPVVSVLRVVGNTIEKIEVNDKFLPENSQGTIYNPKMSDHSITMILRHYNSTSTGGYDGSSLIFITNGMVAGIFIEGVSPILQTNIVAVLISLLYVVMIVIKVRRREYPENLDYPQNTISQNDDT